MAAGRTTIFFSSSEGYGWTENYWFNGSQTGDALTNYMISIAHKRALFLTSDSQLERIRVQGTHKRDPLIFDFENDPACIGQLAASVNNSSNAVLTRIESTDVGYNRNLIRGIPDADINQNVFEPDPNWLAGWNIWKTEIRDSGNWAVVANVDNPQPPKIPATLDQGSPRGIKVTMNGGDTLPFPGKVRVSGSSVFGYNGVKNVVLGPVQLGPNLYMLGGARPQGPINTGDTITITPLIPLEGPPTDMFYERFTSRNPGRFFGQRRGRRVSVIPLRR